MFPGETIATGANPTCNECGGTPKLQVCFSNAYYLGTICKCGPYSRETDYFQTRQEAEKILLQLDSDPTKNIPMR
jgi:hypothetical protein